MNPKQVPTYKNQILTQLKKGKSYSTDEIQVLSKLKYSVVFTILTLLINDKVVSRSKDDTGLDVYKLIS